MATISVSDYRSAPELSGEADCWESFAAEIRGVLQRSFGVEFALVSGSQGQHLSDSPHVPHRDWALLGELCREVARRDQAEFVDEAGPLVMMAIPFAESDDLSVVAVGAFLIGTVHRPAAVAQAAALLGLTTAKAAEWIERQRAWTAEALLRAAEAARALWTASRRIAQLETEVEKISAEIADTYEEITLLHRLTNNLKLSKTDESLARIAMEWLKEVLPVEGLAIHLVPPAMPESFTPDSRTAPVLLTAGDCPLGERDFERLVQHLRRDGMEGPVVINSAVTSGQDWPFPAVRELILVPLAEGENLFGWMAATNHSQDGEFGTDEAELLNSVATILGIHSGNIELYRQQAELLAGVVRALTSAIDAKDPYTCGHSERVALVSVALARELGCDAATIKTIYLSGLLHDVGKIGIDDNVLRKPGKLTEAEFEHIKTHAEIGYKILLDLKKLGQVLPVVRHHHEAWNGQGYPHGLAATNIPFLARIVAVADAFDAMGSDRPYRPGMDDAKLDQVMRDGAGTQWDPEVVEAFFRVRDQIRRVSRQQASGKSTKVEPWF